MITKNDFTLAIREVGLKLGLHSTLVQFVETNPCFTSQGNKHHKITSQWLTSAASRSSVKLLKRPDPLVESEEVGTFDLNPHFFSYLLRSPGR